MEINLNHQQTQMEILTLKAWNIKNGLNRLNYSLELDIGPMKNGAVKNVERNY